MKKIFIVLILSAFLAPLFSQEAAQTEEKPKGVRGTFETNILIDNQTVATPYKGGLELDIQHRFSLIKSYHDLFGIYGSANTRLGLNYGITDRLMVGLGTTKDYKLQDIQWKYLIFHQTEDNSMPVSLSYFGNVVIDLRHVDAFGPFSRYRSIHRYSYFTQLIVARKINDMFSAQVAPSFVYYNAVPTGYKNINVGLSAGGRANLFGAHSIILEYDQPLIKQDVKPEIKPNLAFGWEINTATHCFRIFAANYSQIVSQRNLVFNTNDFTKGEYLIGFNITVRF
jgi:hypothetical protein